MSQGPRPRSSTLPSRSAALLCALLAGFPAAGPALAQSDPDSTLSDIEARALADRAAVEAEIAALLKTPVDVPQPPAQAAGCSDAAGPDLDAWVRTASDPEAALLTRLGDARRALQSLGLDDGTAYDVEQQLAARLSAKAIAVMAANAKQRDSIAAVVRFVRAAASLSDTLGQSDAAADLMARLSAWLAPFVPDMLRDLRTRHDYSMIAAVLGLIRQMNLMGLETGAANLEDALAEIQKAMTFHLTLDYQFTATGANGNVESFHLTAELPLTYEIGGGDKEVRDMLVGEGTGTYLSYTDSDGGLRMQAPAFPVAAKIEALNPCAGTAKLFLDRFYAGAETYIAKDGAAWELNMAEVSFMVNYEQNLRPDGWLFDLPLRNLQKTAVDTAIAGGQGTFAGTLQVTLDHRPK